LRHTVVGGKVLEYRHFRIAIFLIRPTVKTDSAVRLENAGNASPSKFFWAQLLDLDKFGWIGQNLSKIKAKFEQNCGGIWAKMITFEQNHNLASPKTFYLQRL